MCVDQTHALKESNEMCFALRVKRSAETLNNTSFKSLM